jgi:hypothetical protein
MIFAASQQAETLFWTFVIIAISASLLWKGYMKTFRTEDYLRIKEIEDREKEKRNERIKQAASLGFTVFKMFKK